LDTANAGLVMSPLNAPLKKVLTMAGDGWGLGVNPSFETALKRYFRRLIRRKLPLSLNDIAGFGLAIEINSDLSCIELAHHTLDPLIERRMVGSITRNKLKNNCL
jgi:hypothetical protein